MNGLVGISFALFLWTVSTVAWDAFNLPDVPTMIQVVQAGAWLTDAI